MKVLKTFYLITILGLLIAMGLAPIIAPHKGLLFSENRPPKDPGTLSIKDLARGTYFTQANDALQDAHPLRQDLINFKAFFQGRLLRRPVVNNVYWKNPALLAYVNGIQTDRLGPDESLEDMGNFYQKLSDLVQEAGSQFIYVGLANQTLAFSQDYPFYMESTAFLGDLEKDFQKALDQRGVASYFLTQALVEDPYSYYLRTDHHLSARGALRAGEDLLKFLDPKGTYDLDQDYRIQEDPRPFVGSRSRKVPGLGPKEVFTYPLYQGPLNYSYKVSGEERPLLDLKPGEKTVDYGVYMGGDQGYAKLTSPKPGGLRLLIYGDSYTNALEAVLAPYCQSLTSFDFRYGKQEDFFKELKTGNYDYVLCIRDASMYLKKSPNGRFF